MENKFVILPTKEKKNEKSPDFNIKVKQGEKWVLMGNCWKKKDKNGNGFLSCDCTPRESTPSKQDIGDFDL